MSQISTKGVPCSRFGSSIVRPLHDSFTMQLPATQMVVTLSSDVDAVALKFCNHRVSKARMVACICC